MKSINLTSMATALYSPQYITIYIVCTNTGKKETKSLKPVTAVEHSIIHINDFAVLKALPIVELKISVMGPL